MAPGIAGLMGTILIVLAVVLVVYLVIAILYLLTLSRALERVAPHNRLMEPWQVWLMLIPCFNVIWAFFVATRLPDSLKNEFRDRGRDDGSDYGKAIALTRAGLGVVSIVLSGVNQAGHEFAQVGSCVGGIIGLVDFVLLIVFWVKIANYSSQLATDEGFGDDMRRRFDRYDDDDRGGRGPSSPDIYPSDKGGPSSPESYRPDDERYTP